MKIVLLSAESSQEWQHSPLVWQIGIAFGMITILVIVWMRMRKQQLLKRFPPKEHELDHYQFHSEKLIPTTRKSLIKALEKQGIYGVQFARLVKSPQQQEDKTWLYTVDYYQYPMFNLSAA